MFNFNIGADQAGDQNRDVELAEDRFQINQGAGNGIGWSDIAIP